MKKIFIMILIGLINLILIFGCSRKSPEEIAKVTLSVASFARPKEDPGYKALQKTFFQFEKENPGIKIKEIQISTKPVSRYIQKLLTMMAGGVAPDVLRISTDSTQDLLKKGALRPLDDFLKKSKRIKEEDFFPVTLFGYKFDGEVFGKGPIYGFPTDFSPFTLLFYNKKLFDEAGISYPTKSLSWEEFLKLAEKLTKRDEKGRIMQYGVYDIDPYVLIYQNGGRVFSEDGKRCLLDSPEAIEAIQFKTDLSTKYHVAPSYGDKQQGNRDIMFRTGCQCAP